jgi:hypothetical protein
MPHLCFRREGTSVLIANIGLPAIRPNLKAKLLFFRGEARFFAVITILNLPHTHDITSPIAAPGTDPGWTKEVQMADGLIPKPPSLSAAGIRSKKSGRDRPRTTLRRYLLHICCICSNDQSLTQLFVAAGGSPGRRPVRIDPAGRLHTFPRKPSRSQSLPLHLVPATGA